MFKEIVLSKTVDSKEIIMHYTAATDDWTERLSQKPDVLEELRRKIAAEQLAGVDPTIISKKYIWH